MRGTWKSELSQVRVSAGQSGHLHISKPSATLVWPMIYLTCPITLLEYTVDFPSAILTKSLLQLPLLWRSGCARYFLEGFLLEHKYSLSFFEPTANSVRFIQQYCAWLMPDTLCLDVPIRKILMKPSESLTAGLKENIL